ncbi:MAG: adenosylcobinamide-phosphate synthase CbiB [Rhizobiaceae bacterium]
MTAHLLILLAALCIDWFAGEPQWLWGRVPHPVVWFGKLVALADEHLNLETDPDPTRYRKGALAWVLLVAVALAGAMAIDSLLGSLGILGALVEALIVFVFLAQKSLKDHVQGVADGLAASLDAGREAVSRIVGRDPKKLDRAGVSRAAIESLAENYSDGIVAPAFWYAIFGLPGLAVYKMINTADSMIAHKNARYLWFGRVSAQADDLANWLPARLSTGLIALGVLVLHGSKLAARALMVAVRDAGIHRSPNAGWPEGAMAGALGIALGGPRAYPTEIVSEPHVNASGRLNIDVAEIDGAIRIFTAACIALWGSCAVLALILAIS